MIVTPIKRYEPCAIDLGHTCYRLRPFTQPQGDRSHDNENDDDNAVVLYIVTSCVQKCLLEGKETKMGDFQRIENDDHCTEGRRKIYSDFDYFDNDDLL